MNRWHSLNPAIDALTAARSAGVVAVAFSGGVDSTCLLYAATERFAGHVRAIHVHHGLQTAADDFARHAERVCAALGVPLDVIQVDARHRAGDSPEATARSARYRALADAARAAGADRTLLAHHADDQVETVLIALGRGAGLAGLAGMAPAFDRHGMRFERPLLGLRATALRRWAAESGTAFVDDPTNADLSFVRNRLRLTVAPALESAFPALPETVGRSAAHAAQAQGLLDEIADEDLRSAGDPPKVDALRILTPARRINALRRWLRAAHAIGADGRGGNASATQMRELSGQIEDCATRGHRISIKVGGGFVERTGDRLRFSRSL